MSRTLIRLRAATGDPLLVRAGRRMVLTPHAEAIRTRTRDTLDDARAVLSSARTQVDLATLRRTFTIRANDGFVEAFASLLIAEASAAAPNVLLRFAPKPEKTAAHLRDGSADLEIGVLGQMGPEVRLQALFRDRFVGVVRSGHPLQSDGRISAERYAAFGHVVAARHGNASGPVDEALAALGLTRKIAAVVPSSRWPEPRISSRSCLPRVSRSYENRAKVRHRMGFTFSIFRSQRSRSRSRKCGIRVWNTIRGTAGSGS